MKRALIVLLLIAGYVGAATFWHITTLSTGVVSSQYEPERFAANGSTTTFAFSFPLGATTDLEVYLVVDATGVGTELTLTTDYSLSFTNNNLSKGGTITTVDTYDSGYTIVAIRNTAKTQTANFIRGQDIPEETLEGILDRQTMSIQDLWVAQDRSPHAPATDDDPDMELPNAIDRASKYLAFDAAGDAIASSGPTGDSSIPVSSFMETVLDDTDGESVMTTLGGVYVYNVQTFGATGDGSTDDTVAMNLATTTANSDGGGTVYVPKGTYKLTSSLILHSNTTLWMDPNAVLLRNFAGAAAVAGYSAKNGTIRNATLDVSDPDTNITIIGGQIVSDNVSYVGNHLMMWGVDNFRMEGTRVRQAYGNDQGLIYRGNNAVFSNLNIDVISVTDTEATPNDGLHIASGSNIRVTNCYIKAEDDSIALANYNDDGNSAITDVVISNCIFVSNRNNIKISHAWNVTNIHQRIAITNCIGYQLGGGGEHLCQNLTILPEESSDDSKIKHVVVSNCIFHQAAFDEWASYNAHGVFVKGSDNVLLDNVWVIAPNRTGFWIQDCDNVQIRGGGVDTPRNSGYPCVQLYTVDDILIDGAYLSTPTGAQNILINDECDNIRIINCDIRGIVNAGSGIATNAGSTVVGLNIRGNMFSKGSTTAYGYQAAGTESYILFADNDCRGVTSGVKTIGDVNSNLMMRNNIGYVTENSGTDTLENSKTSVAVTHGMSETPTTVSITWAEDPANAIADWWVSAVGATTFTLNGANPGATNLDFYWEAKVR